MLAWFAVQSVTIALILVLAVPGAVDAQPAGSVPKIGIVITGSPTDPQRGLEAFQQELRTAGHIDGQTISLQRRYAMGRIERLDDIVTEVLADGATLLVTSGPYGSLAAKRATTTVPIVFVAAQSPVDLGLVTSLARPGGNITGVAWDVGPETTAKQLALLREAVPRLARVAFLFGDSANPDGRMYAGAMDAVARHVGVKLQVLSVPTPERYDAAFRAVTAERADGLVVAGNARNFVHRKRILEFASARRLPAAYGWKEAVEEGGLLSYGPDMTKIWRRAAVYVDKIVKGGKPADLPVEQPTSFELVVNRRTARALGVTIPQSLLIRADQTIE